MIRYSNCQLHRTLDLIHAFLSVSRSAFSPEEEETEQKVGTFLQPLSDPEEEEKTEVAKAKEESEEAAGDDDDDDEKEEEEGRESQSGSSRRRVCLNVSASEQQENELCPWIPKQIFDRLGF